MHAHGWVLQLGFGNAGQFCSPGFDEDRRRNVSGDVASGFHGQMNEFCQRRWWERFKGVQVLVLSCFCPQANAKSGSQGVDRLVEDPA